MPLPMLDHLQFDVDADSRQLITQALIIGDVMASLRRDELH